MDKSPGDAGQNVELRPIGTRAHYVTGASLHE